MLYQVDKLNYYYDYQFKLIRMASRSDSFLMVPPKMMENLKEIIIQDNQAHLEVLIQVEVRMAGLTSRSRTTATQKWRPERSTRSTG